MPPRRRWTPVKGTATRVVSPVERLAVAAVDAPFALVQAVRGRRVPPLDPVRLRDVLVLRLDRIGDVLMSLPALHDLRAALPQARLRLAVGGWSEEVARRAPVDEVLVWSAPWAGRASEGVLGYRALLARVRRLAAQPPDAALDLQGDVRAALLMRLTGAAVRVGYANTGGAHLLTHVVPLDETVSWVEQNRRAAAVLTLGARATAWPPLLTEEDRAKGRAILEAHGVGPGAGPLVGVHPSGGRPVKQWPVEQWADVISRLQEEDGARVVVTGSGADRPLAEELARRAGHGLTDLTGRLSLAESMAVIGALDLFLSPDTGPMHVACAVGTPSVSVFGPSDAVRYFSGGTGGRGTRHAVVRKDLWCAPCNLIRRPPAECVTGGPPECLGAVTAADVLAAARDALAGTGR